MFVEIHGTNLPGTHCGPNPNGETYENVHVGLGLHRDPVDLVRGDAPDACWRVEVRVSRPADGSIDFHGPFVQGPRGDRFLYLNWGTVDANGTFHLFRRAKLSLSQIDPALVEDAIREYGSLSCTVGLTDSKGNPICARLRSPNVTWQVTLERGHP